MRALIKLISLCILLLGGGEYLHANTHKAPLSADHHFNKKHQVKFTNQDSGNSLIEDAELNIDEEFHNGDDLHTGDIYLAAKQSLLDNWYLDFSQQFILDDYSKCSKIFTSFSGDSNPIYIRQQVLRI